MMLDWASGSRVGKTTRTSFPGAELGGPVRRWRICALGFTRSLESFPTSLLLTEVLLHGGVLHALGFRKVLQDFRSLTSYSLYYITSSDVTIGSHPIICGGCSNRFHDSSIRRKLRVCTIYTAIGLPQCVAKLSGLHFQILVHRNIMMVGSRKSSTAAFKCLPCSMFAVQRGYTR